MKKFVLLAFAAVLAAGSATEAAAHKRCGTRTPGINHRERNQQRRIIRGVNSGELTGRETLRLEREQFAIRREERQARADGTVTPRERAELQRELNQASRHIYRAKHNEKDRN